MRLLLHTYRNQSVLIHCALLISKTSVCYIHDWLHFYSTENVSVSECISTQCLVLIRQDLVSEA